VKQNEFKLVVKDFLPAVDERDSRAGVIDDLRGMQRRETSLSGERSGRDFWVLERSQNSISELILLQGTCRIFPSRMSLHCCPVM